MVQNQPQETPQWTIAQLMELSRWAATARGDRDTPPPQPHDRPTAQPAAGHGTP